jgi:hypothetical protein
MNRRHVVLQGFGLAALLEMPQVQAAATELVKSTSDGSLDLTTPEGNVLALAKMTGTLQPGAHKHGWYSGVLMGVVPGEAVRDLVGIVGMSSQRLRFVPERKGYQLLQKECGFFLDLETGAILDRWRNPYLDEWVEPFHIANPAVNRWILPVVTEERFYDRADGSRAEAKPFILPWKRAGDRLMLEQRVHFWAKNPLDPAVWKRESSGAEIQVSDAMSYNTSFSALADPQTQSVDYSGHWVHVRPWQPWMLMGNRPGHCLYSATTGSAASLADVPADIVALTRARHPDFLEPPTEVKPSEPSMIRYMRERKPA